MRKKTDYDLILENGGKYALVMGVTRRAKQLVDGARPVVETSTRNAVATAMDEVAQGRLQILPPEMPHRSSPLRPLPLSMREKHGR